MEIEFETALEKEALALHIETTEKAVNRTKIDGHA